MEPVYLNRRMLTGTGRQPADQVLISLIVRMNILRESSRKILGTCLNNITQLGKPR
jgi:hypothetical protein